MMDTDDDPYEYDATAEQRLERFDAWLGKRDVMDPGSTRESVAYTQRDHDREAQPHRAVSYFVAFLTESHMAYPDRGTVVFGTSMRDLAERIVSFYHSHLPVDVLDLETGEIYTAAASLRLTPTSEMGVGFIL